MRSATVRRRLAARLVALLAFVSAGPVAAQQTGTITGRVTDATTGQGIASAQISVEGTRIGIVAQANGRYLLLNVPAGPQTIRVDIIGYASQTQEATVPAGGSVTVDFQLRTEAISLEEVVVTGTAGAARRREIGNSVAALDINQLKAVKPPTNVSDLLQGQVAGLQQFTSEGQAGAGTQLRLRGNNSITQGNSPLIYVDGVRLVSALPSDEGSQQMTTAINLLNADDIERIEVIRGAAATTLYGTEANSGVIQIFTKRGRRGRPVWTFNTVQGTSFLTNNGLGPTIGNHETWQGIKPWAENGYIGKINGSVSGSLENVTYYLSGEYNYESGVLPTNDSKLSSFRANIGFEPANGLTVSANSSYSHRFTNWVQSGDNRYGVILNLLRSPNNYTSGDDEQVFNQRTTSIDDHFVGGITATYNPIPSLTNRMTVGLDWRDGTNDWTIPSGHVIRPPGFRSLNRWRHTTITADYVGTWSTNISENLSSQFSFGGQLFNDYDQTEYGDTENFSGPGLDQTLDSGTLRDNDESLLKVVNAGFFFQEMVGINDQLFLTGGLRVDGNSSFGQDYGLQAYPKAMVSYVVSDNAFWPEWWSTMKLRAAVGESGKAPGVFDAVRTYSPSAGNEDQPGITPNNLGDPDLGPERTREIEFGFEGSAFDDRVSVDFTYYNATTRDALVPVQAPPSEGFANPQLRNVGKVKNSGIELTLGVTAVRSESLVWDFNGTLATNKSEALELEGQQLQIGFQSWRQWAREGSPVPAYYGRKVTNPDAIADPVIVDDAYYGPVYPEYNYTLGTTINFLQRFTFYALGEGSGGHFLMNAVARQNAVRGLWPSCNVANPEAQNALWRARCDRKEWATWILPADYFKLRTVSLTYQMPDGFIPRVSAASLTVAANNIWKSTDYEGLDPEITRGDRFLERREYYHLPAPQQITASLRVVF